MTHILPSVTGNQLGLRKIQTFEADIVVIPHDPCLRFGPSVARTPARLGPSLPAAALTGRDLHPQAIFSFTSAPRNSVESRDSRVTHSTTPFSASQPPA